MNLEKNENTELQEETQKKSILQEISDALYLIFTKENKSNVSEEDRAFMSDIDEVWLDSGSKKQYLITKVIVGLIFAFILWSCWATVDELTRGQGQVVASSRTQVISHLEGGILAETLVTEGIIVEEGQILARVENVSTASAYLDTQNKIWEHEAAIVRLEAELYDIELIFPEHLATLAPSIVAKEQQAYLSRRQSFLSELNVLQSQLQQAEYELAELERRLEATMETRAISNRRLELARPLVAEGLYAEFDFLSLQEEVVRLDGEVNSLRTNHAKLSIALDEAKLRMQLLKSEYDSAIVEEINKRLSELASLEQSFATGSDRFARGELRSPMRGIVNRILLNTQGSAVRPGEAIMEIVPLDDTLLVEAKIKPSDIAFIYPGQEAIVKLTAYDFSIYGGLHAVVEQISADTVEEDKEYFYVVKLRTIERDLIYNGEPLAIIPGMVASVDIITGKKSIMGYLLKPILKAKENALRER